MVEKSRTAGLFARGETPSRRFRPPLKKPQRGFFSIMLKRFQFMREHEQDFTIRVMARSLRVSQSGYYRWRRVGPGKREPNRAFLESIVREVHRESRGR